jgi:hypothetical protein
MRLHRTSGNDLGGHYVAPHPPVHTNGQPLRRNIEIAFDLPVHQGVLLTGHPRRRTLSKGV